ncbi:MAG: hypothetical protein K5745_08415 [Saccharofermentans sp.]|nr:hypothetical protein [Saccharofermentans sp.]
MLYRKCCICGSSCVVFKSKKVEMRSYLCNNCIRKCSRFADVEKMSVSEIASHIELMQREEEIYKEYFEGDNANTCSYPCLTKIESIVFNDSIGFFAIKRKDEIEGVPRDVFRYDEVLTYTKFASTQLNESGIRVFKSDGIEIKFKSSHYATSGVRINMRSRESEHDYVDEVASKFDKMLGRSGDPAISEDQMVIYTHRANELLAKPNK